MTGLKRVRTFCPTVRGEEGDNGEERLHFQLEKIRSRPCVGVTGGTRSALRPLRRVISHSASCASVDSTPTGRLILGLPAKLYKLPAVVVGVELFIVGEGYKCKLAISILIPPLTHQE